MLRSMNLWRYAYRSAQFKNIAVISRYRSDKISSKTFEVSPNILQTQESGTIDVKTDVKPSPDIKPVEPFKAQETENLEIKSNLQPPPGEPQSPIPPPPAPPPPTSNQDILTPEELKVQESDLFEPDILFGYDRSSPNTKSKTKGEEQWDSFKKRYKQRKVGYDDIVKLLTTVYTEAQYKQYDQAPRPVLIFSLASLVPFGALGVLSLLSGAFIPGLAHAQLAYSALFLAFFGGINWGQTFMKNEMTFEKLTWALGPSVLAWIATMMPFSVGFFLASFGFTASLVHDVLLTSYPQWFKALRFVLTVGAIASLTPILLTAILF